MEASSWANLFAGVTAVGALAAVLFARSAAAAAQGQLHQMATATKRQRQLEEAGQARQVFWREALLLHESLAGAHAWGHEFHVVNNSVEPVVSVIAAGWDPVIGDETWWVSPVGILWPADEQLVAEAIFADVAARPLRSYEPIVPCIDSLSGTVWNVGLVFKDALGTWWMRYPDMTLVKFNGLPGTSGAADRDALKRELMTWHERRRGTGPGTESSRGAPPAWRVLVHRAASFLGAAPGRDRLQQHSGEGGDQPRPDADRIGRDRGE